ncbi:MAG TPA: class I SAM-dependent methyltransferase, partial [Anaeromyxobacteraceae bacterium]|nr:class I SAM-dependent methyltransferase [Anaeromyxobacteraceae bacterium]
SLPGGLENMAAHAKRVFDLFPSGPQLLPENVLVRTGPVDHASWNYRPLLGAIQRARFRLAYDLLPEHVGRLLEIGYGSGVFMPALSEHADELLGIDVHDSAGQVEEILARRGVRAHLSIGVAERLPFDSGSVDCVVAVSALEFVGDLSAVCREVVRVLSPGGRFVIVTPRESPVVDTGMWILTGKRAKDDFGDRRARIRPTLAEYFRSLEIKHWPRVGIRLYDAMALAAA